MPWSAPAKSRNYEPPSSLPLLSGRAYHAKRSLVEQSHGQAFEMLTSLGSRWDALPVNRRPLPVKLMATLWLATYVVCIGLVCSFILFEVLDVDGSDFPTPPTTSTPIKLAEPAHEIKRAMLSGPAQLWMLLSIVVLVLEASGLRQISAPAHAPAQPGPRGRRGPRLALPRASLADSAPSA